MRQDEPNSPDPIETARKQRRRILSAARFTFIAMVLTVTLLTVLELSRTDIAEPRVLGLRIPWWLLPVCFSLLVGTVSIALDILTPSKKLATLSAIFFGLLAGLLATVAISFIIDLVAQAYGLDRGATSFHVVAMAKVVIGISLCYLCITIVLGTQDDFRLVIPYVEFAKQVRGVRPLILDTSVLIDGRILEAGQTGFIQAPIIISRFVIDELHALADSSDRNKRLRGRRGLDVVNKLHSSPAVNASIDETEIAGNLGVDQALLELARQRSGIVVSTDIGLVKIGRIRQIQVINLNDLANALKLNLLPGARLDVQLIRRGENEGQAVGYLEDGTMVVVDDASESIGETVAVEVTSSLQTSAGRMIFAMRSGSLRDGASEDEQAPPSPQVDSIPEAAVGEASQAEEIATTREPTQRSAEQGPLGPGRRAKKRSRNLRNPRRE